MTEENSDEERKIQRCTEYSIADQVALSRLLRALAQSHLALDLEAICAASEAGEMPVGPV